MSCDDVYELNTYFGPKWPTKLLQLLLVIEILNISSDIINDDSIFTMHHSTREVNLAKMAETSVPLPIIMC